MSTEHMRVPSRYYTETRPEMAGFVPKDCRRILEIGCGQGNFASALKSTLGCEAWGVEIDHASAAVARQKLDRVLQGDLAAVLPALPARHFDCVVANDVLEHLVSPDAALRAVAELLTANGVVVASIPNVRHFETFWDYVVRRDWKYGPAGILDTTHVRFFTEKSIRRLFEEQGYEIVTLTGINRAYSRRGFRHLNLLLNALAVNRLRDTFFLQFAVVARRAQQPETV